MPTTAKYREKSNTYRAQGLHSNRIYADKQMYSNASTAYDYPTYYPNRTQIPQRVQKTTERSVHRSSARDFKKAKVMKVCVIFALAFALCFSVIYRYGIILESNQEIIALEKQCDEILTNNQLMQAKIDRYLEMGEIEKIAREELGMMRPESYQIFYIDMQMDDLGGVGSAAASDGSATITGTPGALVNAFKIYNSY